MLPQISADRSNKNLYPFQGYLQRSLMKYEENLSVLASGRSVFSIKNDEIHPSMNPHKGFYKSEAPSNLGGLQ
jgi:hypothetical protein